MSMTEIPSTKEDLIEELEEVYGHKKMVDDIKLDLLKGML